MLAARWFSYFAARPPVRMIHLFWAAGVVAASLELGVLRSANAPAIVGWLMALTPGLVGAVLGARRVAESDIARFVLAVSWALPAFSASAALGGALSPAALVFLAGPAMAAAVGGRGDVILAGLVSLASFAAMAVYGWVSPSALSTLDAAAVSVLAVLLAAFFACAVLVSGVRASARGAKSRQETTRLRAAAEAFANAPSPLIACDKAGRMITASDAFRRLAPGAPGALGGLPMSGLGFAPEDEAAIEAAIDARARLVEGRLSFRLRGAHGEARHVGVRAAETPDGFVVELRRSQHEDEANANALAELRAQRDEALAASAAKSEFLASVSHELRTPLNAIIGFSDVMKQRLFGPMPARYAEYADLIHESGRHLLELIGDVLDMSKIEADRYELVMDRFDARDVVDTCAQMIRLKAEDKGLVLSADGGDAPILVEADRKALRQILLNLLSNAVKFTPEGGAVAVMTRPSGGDLVIAVGDSGVGIDDSELARLGERYAQSSSSRETGERGTGLGLSLVKALAEMHGGSMTIQSARGEGTTVTVRMPVLAAAELAPLDQGAPETKLDVRQQIALAQSVGESLTEAKSAAS